MMRLAPRRGRSDALSRSVCILFLCLTFPSVPSWAQDQSVKELLGRAQSEAERKAVEDLIEKLRPKEKSKPPSDAGAASTPQAAKAGEEPKKEAATTEPATSPPSKGPGDEKPREASITGPGDKPAATAAPQTEAKPELSPEKVVEKAERKQLPSVDLEVQFEFDSAGLTPQAIETLTPLGHALSDARLADGAFLIAGHTDAKGTFDYNLRLSQRRAEAVRRFLIENFKIEPERLVAKGFGERHLKVAQSPRAAENRRVQIVNYKEQAR